MAVALGKARQKARQKFTMIRSTLRQIALALLAGCGALVAVAANSVPAVAPVPPIKPESAWNFSLLPKAFQKHPRLAISIITEMTDEGRKITPPTPANPAYYRAYSAGYHEEGTGGYESGKKVSEENLEKRMRQALAASGFLPDTPEHQPTLYLVFFWGVHSKLEQKDDETGVIIPDIGHRNLLSRAQLVGGVAFARELAKALRDQAMSGGGLPTVFDPVYRFTDRDDLTRNLMEQVLDDCYYVVVSAYDSVSIAKGEKKLLWRTKMSTPAQGVSMPETTPTLVDSGADFFGRDMASASIVDKRISRERGGRVDLGPLEVKGFVDDPNKLPEPPAKK